MRLFRPHKIKLARSAKQYAKYRIRKVLIPAKVRRVWWQYLRWF